jgi:hypothetical protein
LAAKIVKAFDSMRSLFGSSVLQQLVVLAILFSNFHGFFSFSVAQRLHTGQARNRVIYRFSDIWQDFAALYL